MIRVTRSLNNNTLYPNIIVVYYSGSVVSFNVDTRSCVFSVCPIFHLLSSDITCYTISPLPFINLSSKPSVLTLLNLVRSSSTRILPNPSNIISRLRNSFTDRRIVFPIESILVPHLYNGEVVRRQISLNSHR
jgi:hypothetical protein